MQGSHNEIPPRLQDEKQNEKQDQELQPVARGPLEENKRETRNARSQMPSPPRLLGQDDFFRLAK